MNSENSRLLFPQLNLVKKEITERFLIVTQAIYRKHPVYTFKDNEENSKVLIYPSYANPEQDGKMVRIIAKTGSYMFHLNDTLNNNMSSEILEEGKVVGLKRNQIIQASLTILIQAYAEEESSDVADELLMLIIHACRKHYSSYGLTPRSVQVSETDIVNNEQKIYQTAITCAFDIPWALSDTTNDGKIVNMELGLEIERGQSIMSPYTNPKVNVMVTRKETIDMDTYHGKIYIRDE